MTRSTRTTSTANPHILLITWTESCHPRSMYWPMSATVPIMSNQVLHWKHKEPHLDKNWTTFDQGLMQCNVCTVHHVCRTYQNQSSTLGHGRCGIILICYYRYGHWSAHPSLNHEQPLLLSEHPTNVQENLSFEKRKSPLCHTGNSYSHEKNIEIFDQPVPSLCIYNIIPLEKFDLYAHPSKKWVSI